MYNLQYANEDKDYYGFGVKKGFWYGEDTESGKKIATSGWEISDNVAMYFLEKEENIESWNMYWIDNSQNFKLDMENFPKVNIAEKMSFSTWLEEVQGITYEDYDENYSGKAEDNLLLLYTAYYTNNTPRFIEIYAEENNIEIYYEDKENVKEPDIDIEKVLER